MKFKNQFNYNHRTYGETNHKPSETIPDQTLSIPELIRRYASGLPLGAGIRVPMYETEDILEGQNWEKFDLSEKAKIMDSMAKEVKNLKNEAKRNKKSEATESTDPA